VGCHCLGKQKSFRKLTTQTNWQWVFNITVLKKQNHAELSRNDKMGKLLPATTQTQQSEKRSKIQSSPMLTRVCQFPANHLAAA